MDTTAGSFDSLLEKAESYAKTTYELSKLKSVETTTRVATSLISRISVIMIFSLFIFILSIGVALLLGELLSKTYYGFFIVAAFYFVAGIVLYFNLPKWINKPLSDLIITQALQ